MSTHGQPGDSLDRRQLIVYVVALGALTALGPFTIDLYLPAFPTLQKDFKVTAMMVQLTLTATTLGFGVGQLLVGPWSDRVGRRIPLIISTSVHVLASVGAIYAPDIVTLSICRVFQGIGAAAGGVVAMATVRDLFSGLRLVRMLSRLALVSGLAPVLAPVIGSQLLRFVDWRGIFVFLAAYGVLMFIVAIFFVAETLPQANRNDLRDGAFRNRYIAIFGDRTFVGVAIIGAMIFSGLFAYLSTSSFLFQNVYEVTAQQFGFIFGINSLGVIVGVQLSARLARRMGPQWILACSTAMLLISSLMIVVLGNSRIGLLGVVIPLFFYLAACGFSFPMLQVLGLLNHANEAATAASILGAMNFGVAALISPAATMFGGHDAIAMGAVMASTSLISVLALWFVVRPRSVPPLAV